MDKSLVDILKILEKERDHVNRKLDIEVTRFLEDFFHLQQKKEKDRISLSDGAVILKWKKRGGKKFGPYWYRCRFLAFDERKQAEEKKKGRYCFDYIAATLPGQEMNRFAGSEEANKWKYARDLKNWPDYERYDGRVTELRAEKKATNTEIKRVKGLIRYGRTELKKSLKKNFKKNSRQKVRA